MTRPRTAEEAYGALVVAAAGNDGSSAAVSPAGCPGVVGVAATDESDAPASFSNYGSPDVFVSAPGVDVYSTVWPDSYATWSGTSMASPLRRRDSRVAVRRGSGVDARRGSPRAGRERGQGRRCRVRKRSVLDLHGVHLAAELRLRPGRRARGADDRNPERSLAARATTGAPGKPASPPPAPASDTKPPFVHAYAASGRRGRIVKLSYLVQDGSGESAETIFVYRGGALVRHYARPLRPTGDGVVYWVAWRAPRTRFTGRFCVRAADPTGNAATSCAGLLVR